MNAAIASPARRARRYAVFVTTMAAVGGLMFGLDVGVIAGAEQFIQREFGIGDGMLEHVVSSMMWGAAVGAALAAWFAGRFGRKRALACSAGLFVVGALSSAAAWSAAVLIVARVVLGLSVGIAAFTSPVYIAEVAPRQTRGAMVSTYQLMITIGIFIAYLSDTGFTYVESWRWMLGVIAIPGALFLLGVLALPESPRWLMLKQRAEDAGDVLQKLRGDARLAREELSEINQQLGNPQQGWRLFLQNRNFRRAVGFGVVMQVVQQFTGINIVVYYAPRIFADMGYGTGAQMAFTAAVGLANMLATLIAIVWVDRAGRKPILYGGFTVMALSLATFGFLMQVGMEGTGAHLLGIATLLVFVIGFGCSAGPLDWILCSEVQPLKGRDFGMGASASANWLFTGLVGATFLTLLDRLGGANTFWMYAGFNLLALLFTFAVVPETKGVTLEQIERKLMSGARMRHLGIGR